MVNLQMTGAQMVLKALEDQQVDTIFGYPGGAVLPIYDELAKTKDTNRQIRHFLVAASSACRCAGRIVCWKMDSATSPSTPCRMTGWCGLGVY